MHLEAKNISFRYAQSPWVLKDLNISIKQGEVVGLIGPSGCGKSTLARILAGYEKPVKGDVSLGGNPLPKKGYNPVQLVFQHPEKSVDPRWRMFQTLSEGGIHSMRTSMILGSTKNGYSRWPNELSAGELQRFCVSRALSPSTRFLIADEMTTMLDAITQAQIYKMVIEIAKRQQTGILAISHSLSLLKNFCERIIDFHTINK
jgi:peptide/nickel transport system ATP-binding protein